MQEVSFESSLNAPIVCASLDMNFAQKLSKGREKRLLIFAVFCPAIV